LVRVFPSSRYRVWLTFSWPAAGFAVATLAAVAVASIGGIAIIAGIIAYTGTKRSNRWQNGAKTEQGTPLWSFVCLWRLISCSEFRRLVLLDFADDCRPYGTQYELFKASLLGNWSQYIVHLVNALNISSSQLHHLTQVRFLHLSANLFAKSNYETDQNYQFR